MGCSGRPEYSSDRVNTPELAIEYFMIVIEAWIKTTGYRDKCGQSYILTGHSLGGYLSTHYAIKYPLKIEKLCLLSTVGVPIMPVDFE